MKSFRFWVQVILLSSLPLGCAAAGTILTAFHAGSPGSWLMGLSGAALLLITILIGRGLGPIMFGVYGTGLGLIFLFMAGPHFVQSVVLASRGQMVNATMVRIVTDPPYPGSTDLGCRSCSHTHGYIFKTSDGRILPGYPYGSQLLRIGDVRPVVFDPKQKIDSRAPGEIQPWRDSIWLLLYTAIILLLCRISLLARKQPHRLPQPKTAK